MGLPEGRPNLRLGHFALDPSSLPPILFEQIHPATIECYPHRYAALSPLLSSIPT